MLAFGGLLLLGGRRGDLFGRRRMVILGIALFTFASLMSGCAMTQEWHIGCRTVQGIGAAIASPTALALVTTNFPQGAPRNKAWGNSVDRTRRDQDQERGRGRGRGACSSVTAPETRERENWGRLRGPGLAAG